MIELHVGMFCHAACLFITLGLAGLNQHMASLNLITCVVTREDNEERPIHQSTKSFEEQLWREKNPADERLVLLSAS